MDSGFTITNADKFAAMLRRKSAAVSAANDKTAHMIAMDAERQIKEELSKQGHGIIYYKKRQGESHAKRKLPSGGFSRGGYIAHRASAPGEPPAPDTGRLRGTTQALVLIGGNNSREILIRSGDYEAKYARALEKGTAHIEPRPFFDITIKANMAKWIGWWKSNVAGAWSK